MTNEGEWKSVNLDTQIKINNFNFDSNPSSVQKQRLATIDHESIFGKFVYTKHFSIHIEI